MHTLTKKKFDKVILGKVNSVPAHRELLPPQLNVNNAISNRMDESSLLGLGPDQKLKVDEHDSIIHMCFLTSPETILEKPTKT